MKSTQLEWMPLHSRAISRTMPGSAKTVLSRRSGVPVILNSIAETSAETEAKSTLPSVAALRAAIKALASGVKPNAA